MPVLLTSGYPRSQLVRQYGPLAPGIEMLVKPFSRAALGAKLAELLGATRSSDPPR